MCHDLLFPFYIPSLMVSITLDSIANGSAFALDVSKTSPKNTNLMETHWRSLLPL
ncbi:hypothetical protein VCRA2126O85_70006 [Vibrio crassostreae]|nr:hypothetical protein VCRA2128O100_170090 [Vibrio crassostreae]CAK3078604.1 hypothetical protein VCRA2126O85_70006 [Vibrio crassostreae]CAK3079335.1 hypothetical protein VCRA2128O106_70006 [Vibrio crassostreae]CAK3266432.1 hypothetical protein VCRA2126O88_180089 [Vibrio crassostreae]CAK3315622.1 hypothetical protein VCRA2128O109_170089 [Vibrio crassostreae]